jgi:hypothetical protein
LNHAGESWSFACGDAVALDNGRASFLQKRGQRRDWQDMTVQGLLAVTCLPLALSLAPGDYRRLKPGEALIEVLPAEGRNVTMRAAIRVDADAERLAKWTRRVDRLYAGPYVSAIARFSDPPQMTDLAGLLLDEEDLLDLRRCRPGNCSMKLDAAEMRDIRQAISAAGADWRISAQQAFRRVVLARAGEYVADGHAPSTSYQDKRKRVLLNGEFAAIASTVALTHPELFPITNFLSVYPKGQAQDVESFLYWSKASLGAKPVVSVTHVAMVASRHATLVAKKQVYASHYLTASLSFTAIAPGPDGAERYLFYLNHSRSDVFDGMFGGLIRRIVEKRLGAEGPAMLDRMRRRLESGES